MALCSAALLLAACGPPAPVAATVAVPAPAPVAATAPAPVAATAPVPVAVTASAPIPGLPPEVLAFKRKRDDCDHFRGEEGYDAERRAFLAAALARSCTGTDQALAALRQQHAANPAVIAQLKAYEDRIE